MTTRQYARLVSEWIGSVGLDPRLFGTHSLRRTKATLIYQRTGNLRAVQLLLGHTKIESTVRYLGIEVDDALAIAEQVDVGNTGQSGHALPTFRWPVWAKAQSRCAPARCAGARIERPVVEDSTGAGELRPEN